LGEYSIEHDWFKLYFLMVDYVEFEYFSVINGSVAGVISWRTFPCGDGLPGNFEALGI
jgi:hypothetical protein